MAEKTFSGIIIKKINYDEFDEIVTIYGPEHTFSFIAKGVRKMSSKNRIALQLGNYIEIIYFPARLNNKLSKLKKASIIAQPQLLKSNVASYVFDIIELAQKVKKPSSRFFISLVTAIKNLGNKTDSLLKTFVFFNALDALGVFPTSNACVKCQRTDEIDDFDFFQGGFLCNKHATKSRSLAYLKALLSLCKSDFSSFLNTDPKTNQEIFLAVKEYMAEQLFFY